MKNLIFKNGIDFLQLIYDKSTYEYSIHNEYGQIEPFEANAIMIKAGGWEKLKKKCVRTNLSLSDYIQSQYTFDILFFDDDNSQSMGLFLSKKDAIDYVKKNNYSGGNAFKPCVAGGTVCVMNNITIEEVYTETIL